MNDAIAPTTAAARQSLVGAAVTDIAVKGGIDILRGAHADAKSDKEN